MSYLIDKARFASTMHNAILTRATIGTDEVDGACLIQIMAGVLTETLLLFDDPDEGLQASIGYLCRDLNTEPFEGFVGDDFLPPAYVIDRETEKGRDLARSMFEEWLDCAYQFHDIVLFFTQHMILRLEQDGIHRSESMRLFAECAARALAYEIAAQELCDIVIEDKIGLEGWNMGECVSGLSAISGRCLGLIYQAQPDIPVEDELEHVAHVMTQEAIRLGIPAGSDWRFGVAANDCVYSAPFDLIFSLWPDCREFFAALNMHDMVDQAVACAKAAGRMVAVAAGGEAPEIEAVIAKPLAMMALTDTYRTLAHGIALKA